MAEKDGPTPESEGQTVLGESLDTGDSSVQAPEGNVATTAEGSVQETPKWLEQTPKDFRERIATLGHKEYKEFIADALETLEKKDSFVMKPGEGASEEDWNRFWDTVGRPSDPKEYDLGPDAQGVDEFVKAAHKQGLTKEQAKGLYEWYSEYEKQSQEAFQNSMAKKIDEAQALMKKEWGGKYENKISNIKKFVNKYGTPEAKKELDNPLIGNSPALIRMFAKAGEELANDKFIQGKTATQSQDDAPQTLQYAWMRQAYPTKPE